MINTILFGWVSLFIRYYLKEDNVKAISNKSLNKWIALSGYAALFLIITFVCGSVIRSMIADSQVSFDVINFFAIINIYSAVGFIVLCLIAISYFALSQVLVYLVKNFFPVSYVPLILSVVVIGLIYLTLKLNFATSFFELALLGWLIIYLFILVKINITYLAVRLNSSLLIFWLFFFSISITGLIVMENNNKELERRKHYAEALANKADPASETLMNTMLTDFRNKFLSANFSRFKNEEDNHFLKDSLINGNFSGYTNKYETKIYCFDSTEAPLFNADSLSINELNAVLNTQGKPTTIPDLYYYDLSYDRFSYMSKKL
ncbi:MAG: hypothetical protein IPP48_10955 [Chitinophagaceae bacterium]|nr:hypothetical protein [Chitinophagaceae bacterium]